MGTNIQEMRQLLENHPERLQIVKDALTAQHPEIAQVSIRKFGSIFPTFSSLISPR